MVGNKLRVYMHFVWTTRDRLPAIRPESEHDLYQYIATICNDEHCDLLAIGGMPDHLHILTTLPATVTMARLMHHVKGASSRIMSSDLQPNAWPGWQSGYGAFSVSYRDLDIVQRYIRGQKLRHAGSRIWAAAESSSEEVPPSQP